MFGLEGNSLYAAIAVLVLVVFGLGWLWYSKYYTKGTKSAKKDSSSSSS